jgi:hypothetical protein
MLGTRGPQPGLFEADTLYGKFVGLDTFYGFLAQHRGELFGDADFASLYSVSSGRPSVPPSLLATALVLQTHDRVSDEEAKERAVCESVADRFSARIRTGTLSSCSTESLTSSVPQNRAAGW